MALKAIYQWDVPEDIEDGYVEWILEFDDHAVALGFNGSGRDDDAFEDTDQYHNFWYSSGWKKVWDASQGGGA